MYGRDLIPQVARYLSDYDNSPEFQYVEWTQSDLLDYFRLSVQSLALLHPSAFTRTLDAPIQNGMAILPDDCTQYIKTVGMKDVRGIMSFAVKELPKTASTYRVGRPVCEPSSAAGLGTTVQMVGAAADSAGQKTLAVSPTTAMGSVAVLCSCVPAVGSADESVVLGPMFQPVIYNWMISYALGTDMEAVPMRERSDTYWKRGLDLLSAVIGVKSKQ
jgi:hypothetical protein